MPRNVGRPCADATDDDPHVAEGGRIRCYFHHRERHKWETVRYRAKNAGQDVSEWDWTSDRPHRPPALRVARPGVIPEDLRATLMGLLDRLEETARPILGQPGHRQDMTPVEVGALSQVFNDLILALERLLYAPE